MIAIVNNNPNDKNPIGISYTDGNPDYVESPNDAFLRRLGEQVAQNTVYSPSGSNVNLTTLGDPKKYERIGIAPSVPLLNAQTEGKLDKVLSEEQSGWQKLRNSLEQTVVSEIGLGTLKGFSDVADFILGNIFKSDNDYSNPISAKLEQWQEDFKAFRPVYADPEKDIYHGGLSSAGWWLSNLPSIASSITLMVPGYGVTKGVSWLGKAVKADKLLGKTRRFLTGTAKLKDGTQLNKFQAFMNNPINVARFNAGFENLGMASVMRIAENYQESRQSYEEVYKQANQKFNSMNDDEYANWLNTHQDLLEESGLDGSDKDAIAKYISKKSADRTFLEDATNLVFDFIQLQGLRSIGKLKSKVNSASIRAEQRASIANAGKTAEDIAQQTAADAGVKASIKPSRWKNAFYRGSDLLKGNAKIIAAESTEGIEEAVNYVAQQEGITFGKSLLGITEDENGKLIPTNFSDRLWNYIESPQLAESAFWGWLGGIVFGVGGSAINTARRVKQERDANEERRQGDDKTKEKPTTRDWMLAGELPEIKAARAAIRNRNDRLRTLATDISDVRDKNLNPFAVDDKGNRVQLPEGTTEVDKEIIISQLQNKFIQDVTLDSINSGTYDLLEDWTTSKEVKQAFSELGVTDDAEFSSKMLSTMRKAKDIYSQQMAHVGLQMTAINAARDNDLIVSPEFTQLIAYDNTQKLLHIDFLENEINRLNEDANEQLEVSKRDLIKGLDYKKTVELQQVSYELATISAREREVKNNTSLSPIEKERTLKNLSEERNNLLRYIIQQTSDNATPTDLGMILQVLRWENSFVKHGNEYLANPDLNLASMTDEEVIARDKELIKRYDEINKLFTKSGVNDSAIRQMADVLANNLTKLKAIDQLKEANQTLHDDYVAMNRYAYERAKTLGSLATTKSAIVQQVDYWNNVFNTARSNAIAQAGEIILGAYSKYRNTKADAIEQMVVNAYKNNRQEAIKQAEELFDTTEEADAFIDALDVLNLSNVNNEGLYNYIYALIGKFKSDISHDEVKAAVHEADNSSTGEIERPENFDELESENITTHNINGINVDVVDGVLQIESLPYEQQKQIALNDDYFKMTDSEVPLDEPGATIVIDENPTIKDDVITPGIYHVEQGIENEETEPASAESTPVEESGEETASSEDDDSLPVIEDTETEELPFGEEESSEVPTLNGKSSPIEHNEDEEQPPIVKNTDSENENLKNKVTLTAYDEVPEDLENADFDAIKNSIKEKLRKDGVFDYNTEEAVDKAINDYIQFRIETNNYFRELEGLAPLVIKATDAASKVDTNMSAKLTDVGDVFTSSFKDVMDILFATVNQQLGIPEVNGKKVIDFGALLGYINAVPQLQTQEQKDMFYNVVKSYILNNLNKSNDYIIKDVESIVDNTVREKAAGLKTNKDIPEESGNFSIAQVNLKGISSSVLNTLNEGDELKAVPVTRETKKGDTYLAGFDLYKEGQKVGSLAAVTVNVNGEYVKYVQNLNWHVKKDGSGKVVSSTADWLKQIFTDRTNPDFVKIVSLLEEMMQNNGHATPDILREFDNIPYLRNKRLQDIQSYDFARNNKSVFTHHVYIQDGVGLNRAPIKILAEALYTVYSNITGTELATTQQERDKIIRDSIDAFATRLFNNYEAVQELYKSGNDTIKVAKVTKGNLNRVTEDNPNLWYDSLIPVQEAVEDINSIGLAIVGTDGSRNTVLKVSGTTNKLTKQSIGQTGIVLDRNSETPILVAGFGIRLNDDRGTTGAGEINKLVTRYVYNTVSDAFARTANPQEAYNKLKSFIYSLFGSSSNKNLALFRATEGQFYIDEFVENASNGTYKGIELKKAYTVNGKTKFDSIRIYIETPYQKNGLSIRRLDGKVYAKVKTANKNIDRANMLGADIINFLKAYGSYNIDSIGIESDNNIIKSAQNPFEDSLFKRNADGSLTFALNGKTYKSYQDFIISNNLIKVNTYKNNGSNYSRISTKTSAFNQTLYVSIPTKDLADIAADPNIGRIEDNETEESKETHTPNISALSDVNRFNGIKTILEDDKPDKVSRMLDVAFEDDADIKQMLDESPIINYLVPDDIQYVPKLNDKDGDLAITYFNADKKVKDVKTHTANGTSYITSHRRVSVGDVFINLLSSNNKAYRNNALRILIHEQIHRIVNDNPYHTEKEIFDSIKPIYNEFLDALDPYIEEFNKDFKAATGKDFSNASSKEIEDFVDSNDKYAKDKNGLGYVIKWRGRYRIGRDSVLYMDEFLAESLTSSSFMKFLDNIKVSDVGSAQQKSLLEKIFDFVCSLLGLNISDDSLLRKEINALSKLDDKPADTPLEKIDEEEQAPKVAPKKRKKVAYNKNIERRATLTDVVIDDNILPSQVENISPVDVNIKQRLNDGEIVTVDDLRRNLPAEDKSKFDSLTSTGDISIVCR